MENVEGVGVKELLEDRALLDSLMKSRQPEWVDGTDGINTELMSATVRFMDTLDSLAESITCKIAILQREKERVLLLQGAVQKIVPKL